jgi:1-deoxy-D-xylulose-5-phosphate reductoisomerase
MAKLAGSPDRCGVAILGSTGTIGRNTLDVIRHHPDRYHVVALTAFSQVEMLVAQCVEFKPEIAVVVDQESAESVERHLNRAGSETRVLLGADHLEEIVALSEVDTVMAGIVGAAGLLPTLAAVRSGKRVLVANKEPLVMMGELITEEARANNAILLPIDSEHNAVFSVPA